MRLDGARFLTTTSSALSPGSRCTGCASVSSTSSPWRASPWTRGCDSSCLRCRRCLGGRSCSVRRSEMREMHGGGCAGEGTPVGKLASRRSRSSHRSGRPSRSGTYCPAVNHSAVFNSRGAWARPTSALPAPDQEPRSTWVAPGSGSGPVTFCRSCAFPDEPPRRRQRDIRHCRAGVIGSAGVVMGAPVLQELGVESMVGARSAGLTAGVTGEASGPARPGLVGVRGASARTSVRGPIGSAPSPRSVAREEWHGLAAEM
jgi:hypothetical protein